MTARTAIARIPSRPGRYPSGGVAFAVLGAALVGVGAVWAAVFRESVARVVVLMPHAPRSEVGIPAAA